MASAVKVGGLMWNTDSDANFAGFDSAKHLTMYTEL
jgi:hypothetical protein